MVCTYSKYQESGGFALYAHACNLLREMTKAYDDALEKYDVLLMPTVKYVATKLPEAEANMLGTVLLNII